MKARCPLCDELVKIVMGDWKPDDKDKQQGRRQRWYWTAEHPGCEGGKI